MKLFVALLYDPDDVQLVGVYTSRNRADAAIERILEDAEKYNIDLGKLAIIEERYLDETQYEDYS